MVLCASTEPGPVPGVSGIGVKSIPMGIGQEPCPGPAKHMLLSYLNNPKSIFSLEDVLEDLGRERVANLELSSGRPCHICEF